MSRQEQWEREIASGYGSAYLDLVRLGVILLDSGQDVHSLKETVYHLSEGQAKEILDGGSRLSCSGSHRAVGVTHWTRSGCSRSLGASERTGCRRFTQTIRGGCAECSDAASSWFGPTCTSRRGWPSEW